MSDKAGSLEIEKLKELFPKNYTALMVAPPGTGEREYCFDLVKHYLEHGEKVVYITTEQSPVEIKEKLKEMGLDIDKYEAKDFVFIDMYSYSTGTKYDKGFSIDNPANLNLITINLTNAAQIIGKPARIIFDSVSTLFLHAQPSEIKKFFGILTSRVKTDFGFMLCTLHTEMHDEQSVIALRAMVDAVIEIELKEGPPLKRRLRVHHARGIKISPAWYVFEIEKGLRFVGEEKPEAVQAAAGAAVRVEKKGVPKLAVFGGALVLLVVIGFLFLNLQKEKSKAEENLGMEIAKGESVKDIYSIKSGEDKYVEVKSVINGQAPKKGWIYLSTPYYIIKINLDRSYYTLFDKINKRELLIYNEELKQKHEILSGSTLGYADLDGENLVSFSSMALDDTTGLEYSIISASNESGYLMLLTRGWDFKAAQLAKDGYDVEGEEIFVVFADKPYFIDAVELSNLQKLGYAREVKFRSPTEIVKDWVLTGEYDSAVIKGGDKEHLNKEIWEQFYNVQYVRDVRKPWHAGSADFSLMFPDHVLIGSKVDGGIIFSLPKGKFRFDDKLGMYGAQVAAEFILVGDSPEKFTDFAVDPVNRNVFFYDVIDYATIAGYKESLAAICKKYGLTCENVIDAREWETKRFAYAITLVKDWYDAGKNNAKDEAWKLADGALEDFKNYEDRIYQEFEKSKPLIASLIGR